MTDIVKIGIAILHEHRILLVRKRNSCFYILPGGKPENGEDDRKTLCREIAEELGCSLDLQTLELVGVFVDDAAGVPGKKVLVKLYSGNLIGTPQPHSEIEELCWHQLANSHQPNLAPSLSRQIIPYLYENRHALIH